MLSKAAKPEGQSRRHVAAGDIARQYLPAMKQVWSEMEKVFDPAFVLRPLGHQFVQTYAVKAAHPELPYALHFLAMMAPLANGASVKIFPSGPSPLQIAVFNVNYAQTRKSSTTGNADIFGRELDAIVKETVESKVAELQAEMDQDVRGDADMFGSEGPAVAGKTKALPRPKINSAVIQSATPEEFFHRRAGDYQQTQNASKYDSDAMRGRHHFGVLANLDEAYDMMLSFGLLSDEQKSAAGKTAKVNPHQSSFNKLLQFGSAARATKTTGSFGAAGAPAVSLGLSANLHPSQYIPMERGESGSHHAATKERFMVSSGRPVQPHAPLPADYKLPAGTSRWKWVPLVPAVAALLQLSEASQSPEAAAKLWEERNKDVVPADTDDELQEDELLFAPSVSGYPIELPDRVLSRLRFRKHSNCPTGFQAEWRVANRSFEVPEQFHLGPAARRVAAYFDKPHIELELDEAAQRLHTSYQGGLNVESHLCREAGDVQGGARLGAAPWQCGVLAGLLLVFDIFAGHFSDDELRLRNLVVTEEHLERAFSLLRAVGVPDVRRCRLMILSC